MDVVDTEPTEPGFESEFISDEDSETELDILGNLHPPPFRLTFAETVQGISEFIEVAIHTILYLREVYPADLFVRRRKYNTAVFQSRHPALNSYIAGAMEAVGQELTLGTVDKVVIVIKNKEHIAMERYIFVVQNMLELDPSQYHARIEEAMTSELMGHYFRSFLLKLNMLDCHLHPLNLDDPSFAVVLELQDSRDPQAPRVQDPPPWIPAEVQHTSKGTAPNAKLHVIRAVNTGVINISMAIQESGEKLDLVKKMNSKQIDGTAAPPPVEGAKVATETTAPLADAKTDPQITD